MVDVPQEGHDVSWLRFVAFIDEQVARGTPFHDWEDLHVWHATSLDGPWTPHPLNPIVSDVRSARSAGRIFEDDGALIRPGQDCSVRYGYAVTLNRIDLLTTSQYMESPVGRIGPEWYPGNTGTHTIDHTDEFEVIDGRAPLPRSWP